MTTTAKPTASRTTTTRKRKPKAAPSVALVPVAAPTTQSHSLLKQLTLFVGALFRGDALGKHMESAVRSLIVPAVFLYVASQYSWHYIQLMTQAIRKPYALPRYDLPL